jgi:formylmethanofuran dehydrogenase subunit E
MTMTAKDAMLKRIAKDVLQQLDRQPICPRCGKPFKKWRHSLADGAPICEPCFALEEKEAP